MGALFFVCAVASAVVPVVGTGQRGGPIDPFVTGYPIIRGLQCCSAGGFTFSARPVRTRRQRLVAALVWVGCSPPSVVTDDTYPDERCDEALVWVGVIVTTLVARAEGRTSCVMGSGSTRPAPPR